MVTTAEQGPHINKGAVTDFKTSAFTKYKRRWSRHFYWALTARSTYDSISEILNSSEQLFYHLKAGPAYLWMVKKEWNYFQEWGVTDANHLLQQLTQITSASIFLFGAVRDDKVSSQVSHFVHRQHLTFFRHNASYLRWHICTHYELELPVNDTNFGRFGIKFNKPVISTFESLHKLTVDGLR